MFALSCTFRSLRVILVFLLLYLLQEQGVHAGELSLARRFRPDPITVSLHTLQTRSPADNTTFGAGLNAVSFSSDKQCVLCHFFVVQTSIERRQVLFYHNQSRKFQLSCQLGYSFC